MNILFSHARRLRRGLLALALALIASAGLVPAAANAAFNLQKLTLNTATGTEDYVFTAGNTVVANGTVDAATSTKPRSYRFMFKDPSGVVRSSTTCTATGAGGAVSGSYAVTSASPLSGSAAWTAVLQQYTDSTCTTVEKTSAALSFNVARASAFGNQAGTLPQSLFGGTSTAYVTVAGITVSKADWSTTWLAPSGTACSNTAGTDRPDSDANGTLPGSSGAPLQYPPGLTGAAWNLKASYDGACPSFSTTGDGSWRMTLQSDAKHVVTLPVFNVDATPPSSSATAPSSVRSSSITVSYTAGDPGTGASGLAEVDLYAKAPGDTGYSKVMTTVTFPPPSGSFTYTASAGPGNYSFYTVAIDNAGNTEAAPASPDATTTLLDTTPPSSSATAPGLTSRSPITVSYTAADPGPGASGLAEVDLYAQAPGDTGYSKVMSDTSPQANGSFSYAASAGDGRYSFYTVAIDNAGNVEAAPGAADATTQLDATAPSSSATAPSSVTSSSIAVSYTATDAGPGASGLAEVDLYAQAPGDTAYSKVMSDTSPQANGSFTYTASAGAGSYSFYTVATDNAGNIETAPASPDATTTLLDTTPPSSSAWAPAVTSGSPITVSFTAGDPGAGASGLAEVDLYAQAPGDTGYSKVMTDTSPQANGSFTYTANAGDGRYSFYTVAVDNAGNAEAAPTSPDATTLLDTTPPSSSATAPSSVTSSSITVSYIAADPGPGASGVAEVDLYAQAPGDTGYSKVMTDTSPQANGSFTYTPDAGTGSYSFYTVAIDNAGNSETAPGTADATTTLLDTTAPSSSAWAPALTSSSSVTVSYTAADPGTGASGLAEVDLYAQAPGDSGYIKVMSDTSPQANGTFTYTANAGDGSYNFYTVATDHAGNVEAAPASPDATTLLDTTPPSSSATAPPQATGSSITVSYTATDPGAGASGVGEIDLYAQAPGDSGYSKVMSDTSPQANGSFTYTARAGAGSYSFYTVATDNAGNVEAAPASPDATTTLLDTTPPSSSATAPGLTSRSPITVSYTAADPGAGASGLAEVDLYAQAPGDTGYSKVMSDTSPQANGSFTYTADAGDGTYSFYTVAIDNAGNTEAAPTSPDATSVLDTTPPSSSATAPSSVTSSSITVSYTAADPGAAASGLAEVDLYAQVPGATGYQKVMSTPTFPQTTGSFTYTASAGDGTYNFYTVATDNAGNTEAAPASPDATTLVRTGTTTTDVVDELHYTFTGQDSVAFDWRGSATDIRYGTTSTYAAVATAHPPDPMPISSPGPFQEVQLTGLTPGTTYHYSIGGGPDHTFSTAPTGDFRFDVEADIGASAQFAHDTAVQEDVASDNPAFVLMAGDLTYGHPFGPTAVDSHFNDVMAWSKQAAYMPVWGNHEWEVPTDDDLRNYKGRFMLPNAQASPTAPSVGGSGEDWSWFDAGGVRFISYPEPYDGESGTTWPTWQAQADPIFAAAQANSSIHYIVTFGHRPAYSDGLHPGAPQLAGILNSFGDKYSKYVLNINGHSHDYERFQPIHGVVNITTGGGGGGLETPWQTTDPRTAFRAFHYEHLRVDVTSTGMRVDAVCGPPSSQDDISCAEGTVLDSVSLGAQPPPPPPTPNTLYVANQNPNCSDAGSGTRAQPFCTISRAAALVSPGQTVIVSAGTYNERVSLQSSGTSSAPIVFTAATGATVTVTGGTNGCFYTNGKAYVTIEGFTVTGCSGDGIVVSKNSSFIKVIGNHVTANGQQVSGSTAHGIRVDITHDDVIADNTVDDNTDYGIYVVGGSYNIQVSGNHVFANARGFQRAASGIRIHDSFNNVISGNVSYDNEDSGIELVTTSHDNLVVNNLIYDNGDHGIDDTGNGTAGSGSPNNTFIGNTVYNNVTAGIDLEGGATGCTVMNNIAVDNGINSPRTHGNIRVYSDSLTGTTLDYNLVYLTVPGQVEYNWNNTNYATLAQMQQASGQEAHTLETSPQWVSMPVRTQSGQGGSTGGDFHLHRGSPAIDSANSGVAGASGTDADGVSRIDDPLTPNTGVGSRTYDDRGPYEYEPVDDPPSAAISVTPSSGPGPLAVTADASASFDNDGISPIATYKFDWGDGSAPTDRQTSPQATHTYTDAGTYTVTVTVVDTAGFVGTAQTTVTVKDNPPVASLTATPQVGPAPLTTTVDASGSSDGDTTPIATYSFDWGDGTAPTGPRASPQATHTYTSGGTYVVTVTVTDTAGLSSQATVNVTAAVNHPPTAALAVSPSSGNINLAVTADASASTDPENNIATYSFDWGDGSSTGSQAAPTATHTYTKPGSYTVKLTVSDSEGLFDTQTQTVSVTDAPPVANLTVSPSSGVAPLGVAADASASADSDATPIATYNFDWGDGSSTGTQFTPTASHTYASAGNYTLTVTVTDTAGQKTTTTAQVSAKQNLVGNPGFETSLTGWNTSGSVAGVTLTRASGGHSGSWMAQLATGSTGGTCTLNDSPNWVGATQSGTYDASLWVRGPAAGATLKLRVVEYNGTTSVGQASASIVLTTSWQKVDVTYTPVKPGLSSLDYNAYITTVPTSSTCFYADDAAIFVR